MQYNRLLMLIALLSAAAGFLLAPAPSLSDAGSSSSSQQPPSKILYTCAMHPQVVQSEPGSCPICGMKLVTRRSQAGSENQQASSETRKIKFYKSSMLPGEVSDRPGKDSMGMDLVPVYEGNAENSGSETIAVDPVTIQNMGIRTGFAQEGPLRRAIRTVGTIAYDETGLVDVSTKFKGWIEKLYVDATGEQVHRGDPLFEIYSPDLFTAQQEYLTALAGQGEKLGNSELRASALTKLKFFDISADQIKDLEHAGTPRKALRINAPSDGFVIEKNVVAGQMIESGVRLYRIADLGLVWLQAEIYEQDLPYIKLGQEALVSLSYLPDREFRGRVAYIYPALDEKTRTAKVRLEFHNPGFFLKPGMFATVKIRAEVAQRALLIPDMAILRSGEKNTVFIALPGGKFEARDVALGLQAENDEYQVLSGVEPGERIVISGQFMLDSESQLREAIEKMREPKMAEKAQAMKKADTEKASETSAPAPLAADEGNQATIKYICPMPEHVSIEYNHPGECPICGMKLVPVSQAALKKLQPGGKLLYYTCPMPEHSSVHLAKPGKCPKCGMTLIPFLGSPDSSSQHQHQ